MSNWPIAFSGVAAVGLGYLTYRRLSKRAPSSGAGDAGSEGGGRIPTALQHISAIATGRVKLPLYAGPALSRLALFLMAPGLNPGPAVPGSGALVTLNEQIKRISMENACDDEDRELFAMSHGLTTPEAEELLRKWGRNEIVEKTTSTWWIIFRQLTEPMPIMLWTAAIIERILGNYAAMGILLGIQFITAAFSFYETSKASDEVSALKASLKPLATVNRDGRWQNMDATGLVPGDLVKLAAGCAIPADCYVNEGEIEVDQSAVTGESLPVKFRYGDVCKMGSTVTRGECEGTIETTGQNTFFGKTACMLQSVENAPGSMPTSLLGVMKMLVSLSLSLCMTSFIFLVVNGNKGNDGLRGVLKKDSAEIVKDALTFAGVMLIASIPFAVQLVTTRTLAAGFRTLSDHGAIVTRLAAFEDLAGLDMLCVGKSGTLTLNKMLIQDECPTFAPGESKETILFQAALATKWNEPPRDALDSMILIMGLKLPQEQGVCSDPKGLRNLEELNTFLQLDFTPFDPRDKRTEAKLQAQDGSVFRITKGAPHVILSMCYNKYQIKPQVDAKVHELGTRGIRSLAIARQDNDDGRWRLLGILTFLDPPRPDMKYTIELANLYGVEVKMITGDHKTIAVETARVLGMGTIIEGPQGLPVLDAGGAAPMNLPENYGARIVPVSGFAQLFPEHKYLIVETLRQVGYRCGMVGNGVSDAPALKRADVGFAMQDSTDTARAAADIVLTNEGLGVIIDAIKTARETFARLKNFITYSITAALQMPTFFFIALFALPPRVFFDQASATASLPSSKSDGWPAFFQLPASMIMLTKLLSDGALWLSNGYDRVCPSPIPERMVIGSLFSVSCVLGAVSCGSSLLLLWAALDSYNPNGVLAGLGIPPLEYGKIITMMFLKLLISDILTFFSARTQGGFFWEVRPGGLLLGAAMVSLSISTYLASFWPEGELDGLPVMGLALGDYKFLPLWIWIYCLLWWFIQDAAKVATTRILMATPRFRPFKVDREKYERQNNFLNRYEPA